MIAILLMPVAFAATNLTLNAPDAYVTSTSTSVLFNETFYQTTNGNTVFNVELWTGTSSSGPWTKQDTATVLNNTHHNATVSLSDGIRYWWFFNVTNGTSATGDVVSPVRLIDVDQNFLTLTFGVAGKINMTLDDGSLKILNTDTVTPALEIEQDANTGTGALVGALVVDNTDNSGYGLNVYSNRATATDLSTIRADNPSFSGNVFVLQNDGTGHALYIDQNGNQEAIEIQSEATSEELLEVRGNAANSADVARFFQDHASSTGRIMRLQQDGTGVSVFLDINADAEGINIDSEATTDAKYMYSAFSAGAMTTNFQQDAGGSSTQIVRFGRYNNSAYADWHYRNLDSTKTAAPVLFIEQDHASDDQPALRIQDDGTGRSFDIDTNTDGNPSIYVDGEQTSTAGVQFLFDAVRTGTASDAAVFIRQDHASSSGHPFSIQNDGTGDGFNLDQNGDGKGIFVDQNGDGPAITVDSEATTEANYGIDVVVGAGAAASRFQVSSNNFAKLSLPNTNTQGSHHIYRNYDSGTSNAPVFFVEQDQASDDQDALKVQQDGSADSLFLDQNGDGLAIHIDSEATTTNGILLEHSGLASASISHALRIQNANGRVKLGKDNSSDGSSHFYRNLAGGTATSGPVVFMEQDSSSDDQDLLFLQQDGTAQGIQLQQNGNAAAVAINNAGDQAAMNLNQNTALASGLEVLGVYDNVAETAGEGLVTLKLDNAGSSIPVLLLQNDGTGQTFVVNNNNGGNMSIKDGAGTSWDCGPDSTGTWSCS